MRAVILIAALAFTGVAGCVNTGTTTTVSQAQTLSGTIVSVRPVTVSNNTDQIAGAVAGAVVGGIVGNQFGGGTGRDVMTGLGALGGAAAGSRLAAGANNKTRTNGLSALSTVAPCRSFRMALPCRPEGQRRGAGQLHPPRRRLIEQWPGRARRAPIRNPRRTPSNWP